MATAVTVLVGILSAGLLTGRVYELLRLIDPQTGFFIYKGIVFNPIILTIFVVIVICCGILVFGDETADTPFFSKSSRPIAVAAGAMLAAYAVFGFMAGEIPVAATAGALAMLTVGIAGLSVTMSAKNIAAVVFSMVFFIGYCLDVIVVDVSTIHNVAFTKEALCTVAAGMLILCVMKSVWSPSKRSKMYLYIAGLLAFAFCGVMNIADIVCIAVQGAIQPQQLVFHAGFAFIGLYGMDNAVSVLPKKQKVNETETETEPAAEQVDVENVQDTLKAQLTAFVDSQKEEAPVQEEEVTAYVPVQPASQKSSEYTKFFEEIYGSEAKTEVPQQIPAPQPPQQQPSPAPQPVSLNIKQLTEEIPVEKPQPQQGKVNIRQLGEEFAAERAAKQAAATAKNTQKTTWKADSGKTVYRKPKN